MGSAAPDVELGAAEGAAAPPGTPAVPPERVDGAPEGTPAPAVATPPGTDADEPEGTEAPPLAGVLTVGEVAGLADKLVEPGTPSLC